MLWLGDQRRTHPHQAIVSKLAKIIPSPAEKISRSIYSAGEITISIN
jgi:hypothetical protein